MNVEDNVKLFHDSNVLIEDDSNDDISSHHTRDFHT